MHYQRSPLLFAMLAAFMLRTLLGAPCCMDAALPQDMTGTVHAVHAVQVAHGDQSQRLAPNDHGAHHSAHHSAKQSGDHSADHSGDTGANPCCSACGPTLPPEPAQFTRIKAVAALPEPALIKALKTRPPFPSYEATGPPVLI